MMADAKEFVVFVSLNKWWRGVNMSIEDDQTEGRL